MITPFLLAASITLASPPGAPSAADTPTTIFTSFTHEGSTLAATIYLPPGRAPGVTTLPGIVILGGSERGPRTPMTHRLAEHFAARGVAALIYDSPGTGESTGAALFQTRQERADEALAALRCLGAQPGVDADRVGIAGISEGALVTLLAAASDDSVAFAIPISGGFGSSMTELARFRIETQGLALGLPPDQIDRALLLEEILFALFAGPDRFEWPLIQAKAERWPNEPWHELIRAVRTARDAASPEDRRRTWTSIRTALGAWRAEAWFELVVVDTERFDRLLRFTPEQVYAFLDANPLARGDVDKLAQELAAYPKIRCPVLAVWGEHDRFLPPHISAAFLERILDAAGHDDATFVIVPDATHILTRPDDDTTFAGGYPDLLTDWLAERFDNAHSP